MSSGCPYIYDTNGIRHRSGQVFVRVQNPDGTERVVAVRSDNPADWQQPYVTPEGVEVRGSVHVDELKATQQGFVLVRGVMIEVAIESGSTHGRRGRQKFDEGVFARVRMQQGDQAAKALANLAVLNLPGLDDENVGESRQWARGVLLAASRELDGGLLGVLREHPAAVQLLVDDAVHTGITVLNGHVATALLSHANLQQLLSGTSGLPRAAELRDSSDAIKQSAYRTLSGDRLELLRGVLSLEPVEARSALLQLGSRTPVAVLEALLESEQSGLVKVAAFYALKQAAPDVAERRAASVLGLARTEKPLSSDTARLCEVAVSALSETMRAKLAADTTAPWLWQKVAVSSIAGTLHHSVIDAVCESVRSHPLARIAAVGRCNDQDVLGRVAAGSDKRLAVIAQERLGAVRGESRGEREAQQLCRVLPDASQIRLVAIDIDGTFAADDDTVPERNKQAVRNFASSGGAVVFSTTRSAEYALPLAREALDSRGGYLVCDDGASIIDIQSGVFLRGATPIGDNAPKGSVRDGNRWLLEAPSGAGLAAAAEVARSLSGPRGVVVLEKTEHGAFAVRYGTDKGTTLEDVALLAGVDVSECCVFGDGKVDIAMFSKVRDGGGVVVAVANAQPGVNDHASVSMRTLSNNEGGVGHVIEALCEGTWPILEREETRRSGVKEEVYSQFMVQDGEKLAESLRSAGLGHLVAHRRGSTQHGASVASPGHVTFAHPSDFKGRQMPAINDAVVSVVGFVDNDMVTALVCAIDDGSGGTTTRADGKTFHVTVRTQNGVPPVWSNNAIADGWERLERAIPVDTMTVRARRR
jgi:hydroxymethylpyrimidine pyrophosphatase-like HAD family hydrolase